MKVEPSGSRRGLLANAAALLILAGVSGVLAPLLVETGGHDMTGSGSGGAAPESGEQPAPAPALGPVVRSEPQPTTPAAAITGEEQQAGERDRQLIETRTRDLASAREELSLLKARLAAEVAERLKISEALQSANAEAAAHRQALEQEREETTALARDLESTREQVEYLTAKAARAQAEAAEHMQALDRERKRAFILEPPAVVLGPPISVKTTPVPGESQRKIAPSAPMQQSFGATATADDQAVRR